MTSPITQVNFMFRKNLAAEAKVVAGYFREVINHYGLPIRYYRLNTDYFETPSGTVYSNYTYGESPTSPYSLSAELVAFIKMDQDSPMLRRFGIETTNNSEVYFMRDDFTESLRDIAGTATTGYFNTIVSGYINNHNGYISGDIINSDISGYTSAYISNIPSGYLMSSNNQFNFIRYPLAYNDMLYKTNYYTSRVVNGTLTGDLFGDIDLSGNGFVSGNIDGVLNYYTPTTNNPHWNIAPQVGDFIRLSEFDTDVNNQEEYEITNVLDKDLSPAGVNPLLKRYIWKCSIVRRDPSKEQVSSSTTQETFTPNYTIENDWHEIVSNSTFNYETSSVDSVDTTASDNSYGGY